MRVSIHYYRHMALNIKDPEADRLVRELVAVTGESITDAARKAFAERLQRVRARNVPAANRARVRDIIDRGRARQAVDARSDDEILGYDENGIPES
jgi:antitoxin VapB